VQYRRSLGICLAGAGLFALMPATVLAQSAPVVARAVVQSLPSAASQKLNAALARLARDPRDVSAFVDAGDAASAMGDLEAAVGFYRRAEQFAASDPRVKAGLAHALVLQGKPADAIPLFAQADVGGAGSAIAADRGLAYDLVGDTATAQRYYRSVLAQRDDDEARRRLGISLAIAGDEAGSEAMLMPLLRKQDKPAWRAHAFAQAIAGKTTEAVSTVNAILPGTLAQSVSPYLRYMPRLTAAQQAAAANLGKFPRASEIGHDDPAIAAFAPVGGARLASADAALIPQGKPLGSGRARGSRADAAATPTDSRSTRRSRAEIKAEAARLAANTRVAPPDPVPAIARDTSADSAGELPPIGGAPASVPASAPASTPSYAQVRPTSRPAQAIAGPTVQTPPQRSALAAREPIAGGWQPAQTQRTQAQTPQAQTPQAQTSLVQPLAASAASPTPTPASRPSVVLPQEAGTATPSRASALASATPPPSVPTSVASSAPSPGFDLTRLGAGAATTSAAATPAPVTASTTVSSTATPPAPARNEAPPPPATLAQIFADLGTPTVAAAPVAGAVDIRTIAAVKPQPPVKLPVKPQPKVRLPEVTAAKAEEAAEDEPKTPAGRKAALAAKGVAKTPAEKAALAKKGEDAESADAADAKKGTAKTKADARKLAAKDAESDTTAGGKTAAAKKAADAKKKAEAKKAASHPSRIWVQVGVGRSTDAIAFDWRKSVKQAPVALKGRTPFVSDMGRTNRVLVGPFESQKAASAFVAQAKKADFGGAFVWTSQAGQVVDPLPLK